MSRSVEAVRAEIHGDLDRWFGEEYDRLAEMLDDLLQAHAHELAEKIRANCNGHGADLPDAEDAADLIDPEVSG
ncbi:hypothetical protein ACFVHB_20120 [Kitasatospora sp. NPDC127111]|uniref:hypothetical protein n=1 Tax=Kitasatospora sp. NPDC127111 TaxID=3345363 RepID=UPI003629E267